MRSSGYGKRDPIITSNGTKTPGFHTGQDFGYGSAGVRGTPVIAAGSGRVIRTYNASDPNWGNRVDVDHGDNLVTIYRHMNVRLANVGDVIAQGQQIGTTGDTGAAAGVHLHFQTEYQGQHMQPDLFFDRFNSVVVKPPVTTAGDDDMFKIINTAGGDKGIHIIGISGRRMEVQGAHDLDLLQRFQRQDQFGMLLSEMTLIEERYLRPLNSNL